MKELQDLNQDKLEVQAVVPIKKELKHLGSLKPQRGHTCFQLNIKTREITVAEFESVNGEWDSNQGIRKKLVVKEDCLYATALNANNSIKKFDKMLQGVAVK